jgi:ABC-type phosphate transport system substrate-binding protein
MRLFTKLLAGSAAAATMVALAAGPALADPPTGVTPKATDIVGVGSDTSEFLFDQFAHDYDNTQSGAKLYSWDATNPSTGAAGDPIVTKSGCASIARPDGGNAGITALEANTADGSNFCIDYARSARGRAATDPPYAAGGIAFVATAGDAVTWATRDAASGGTNAPTNLSPTQLKNIYLCNTTNWDKVGGKNGKILPFLPVTGSGIRTVFLTALGGGTTAITPGACVNSTVQQNEGIDPQLNSPDAVVPFSVAKYIAQVYHSAACTNSACTPVSGQICTPTGKQNLFGCNESGVLGLNKISNSEPALPWPLPAPPSSKPKINSNFTALFQSPIYTVVRFDASTADHIPAYLEKFFSAKSFSTPGWVCKNAKATTDMKNYGFLPSPLCGATN